MSRVRAPAADGDQHLVAAQLAVRRGQHDLAALPAGGGDLGVRAARRPRASRSDAATASPAAGSRPAQQPVAALEQRHLRARAPATRSPSRSRRTPPPRMSSRPGTSLALVASRGVHGVDRRAARRSAGRRPSEPVHTATACRAVSRVSVPSASVTTTVRSPSSRPVPRIRSMPAPSTHLTWPESSQCEVNAVAAGERRGDVLLAGHRLRRAVDGARLGEHLGAAQQRLARHARPVRALAADELALHEDGGQPAPDDDVGDVLARRARPEDDDVVGLLRCWSRGPSWRCGRLAAMPVDSREFTAALRQYAAGVCLLTVRDDIDDVGHDGHLGHERLGRRRRWSPSG